MRRDEKSPNPDAGYVYVKATLDLPFLFCDNNALHSLLMPSGWISFKR